MWERDWPRVIGLIDAHLARWPDHPPAKEKLYAALVSYSKELIAQGKTGEGVQHLQRAQILVPGRGEAAAALAGLTPTPSPRPDSGTLLYQADWASGSNGWTGSSDWKFVSGMLVNSGSGSWSFISSPYRAPTPDYAVETEIQWVRSSPRATAGVFVRGTGDKAYHGGIFEGSAGIGLPGSPPEWKRQFNPGDEWRRYRLEAKANTITLIIGDSRWMEITDNRFLDGVGNGLFIWAGTQINVRSFKVIVL